MNEATKLVKFQALESSLRDDRKKRISVHLDNLSRLFVLDAEMLQVNWSVSKNRFLGSDCLEAIDGLSDTLRREFPLKALTEEDIATIRSEIDNILNSLGASGGTFDLTIRGILGAVAELLRDYPYIDTERMAERAVSGYTCLQSIREDASSNDRKDVLVRSFRVIITILNVAMGSLNAVVVIDQAPDAVRNVYVDYLVDLI